MVGRWTVRQLQLQIIVETKFNSTLFSNALVDYIILCRLRIWVWGRGNEGARKRDEQGRTQEGRLKTCNDVARISSPTSVKPVNNLICWKTGFNGWWNAQQRYSTRFAAMWQDKLHVSCCPFVRPLKGARAILPKVILVWVNMCQRRSFWQDVASTEWPLYIRGPDTNCRWEKEWASLLSLRQRSGLNSTYKGSLKYFSERVVA